MVFIKASSLVALLSAITIGNGMPMHQKRIDQTTIDAPAKWEAACDAAGGGQQCNTIAVNAAQTLLAAAGACDQQNSGDLMVNLAKQLNNNADMITFAQIFVQQPRNSPTSQAVPYCQQAPQNAELNGFFQCQFQGDDQTTFVGGLAVGAAGTIPFGLTAPLSPPGSCPANPSGPITDGSQLTDITSSPGTPAGGAASGGNNAAAPAPAPPASSAAAPPPPASSAAAPPPPASSAASCPAKTSAAAAAPPAQTSAAAPPPASSGGNNAGSGSAPASGGSSSSFALSNGQAAQKLNAQFATLTTSSPCTAGENACVNGGFAQCVGGAFVVTGCAAGEICAALPLVNSAGTSITCTTTADAQSRIAATGATGGITGSS